MGLPSTLPGSASFIKEQYGPQAKVDNSVADQAVRYLARTARDREDFQLLVDALGLTGTVDRLRKAA